MGTGFGDPAMKSLFRENHGQALVELALVIFLFYLVITGILQLAMLGSAQIRCQEAVRRAAWLRNIYHNSPDINHNGAEVQAILPVKVEKIGGNEAQGMVFKATYQVPAVGFFRVFSPQGFTLQAQSAVIAYNPKPLFAAANQQITQKAQELLNRWMGK
jgi:hypothetical protein